MSTNKSSVHTKIQHSKWKTTQWSQQFIRKRWLGFGMSSCSITSQVRGSMFTLDCLFDYIGGGGSLIDSSTNGLVPQPNSSIAEMRISSHAVQIMARNDPEAFREGHCSAPALSASFSGYSDLGASGIWNSCCGKDGSLLPFGRWQGCIHPGALYAGMK